MKIKQKRQVNLPQLIEWAWEKNFKDKSFFSIPPQKVVVDVWEQNLSISTGYDNPNSNTRFEIEEEVEVDEDTVLDKVIELYTFAGERENVQMRKRISISKIINKPIENLKTTHIYYPHPDGTMTLIWKDGEMVE